MKIKTSELTGAALDWAVCMAEGLKPEGIYISMAWGSHACLFRRNRDEDGNLDGSYTTGPDLLFSRKWEAGGPIISRIGIDLNHCQNGEGKYETLAQIREHRDPTGKLLASAWSVDGEGPDRDLIAAMRCYVASKLGDEVEIPEELK